MFIQRCGQENWLSVVTDGFPVSGLTLLQDPKLTFAGAALVPDELLADLAVSRSLEGLAAKCVAL